MQAHAIQQSSRIEKISKSALQFRQLIDSLRNNLKVNRAPGQPQDQRRQVQELKDAKDESTLMASENKAITHSNNFLLYEQSENGLRPKQKMEVGDRDKLKKSPFLLDSNPQIQFSHSKIITKFETSTQLLQSKHKNQTSAEISHKFSIHVSTQYQIQSNSLINSALAPRNNLKAGQIHRQNFKIAQKQQQVPGEEAKRIKDINEKIVIQYYKNQKKISQKSTPSEIFSFFSDLIIACGLVIKSPHIKKYKNCIYFGHSMAKDLIYQGFLYFYDRKIYYGQFYNGFKHGLGVQISFSQNMHVKGQFREGHKTGKFYVQKPAERYIGYLENGLYHGEGRLTKEDYFYQGMFDKGQKNGYGEQFYPKTGVRITGQFRNGVLQRNKQSKSIPEIKNKAKSFLQTKQKDRLQVVRKKSFQKHNFRMNKIREKSFRENGHQIPLQATQQSNGSRVHFNPTKLEVYRLPIRKLPKIYNEFEYNKDIGQNTQSIGSQQDPKQDFIPTALKAKRGKWEENCLQRMPTNQLQEPLPTPCFTILRGRK